MAKKKKSAEKKAPKKEEKPKAPGAPVCVGCLRWEKFGSECWVYWEGKKFCTMKVNTIEDWKNMEQ